MTIKFGTDGWRAIIADEFTFENVAICVQGVAGYIKEIGLAARGMVVGYDTRFSSKEFATCAAEVLAGNGIPTLLCKEASPTPVVSYNVLVHKAAGAVVITASHNPPEWNGLKFKPDYGAVPLQRLRTDWRNMSPGLALSPPSDPPLVRPHPRVL